MKNIYKINFAILMIVLFLLLSACEDQIVNECTEEEVISDSRLGTLSAIQKNVFDVSCATSGCHSGQFPAANLNLEDGNSFTSLVNVGSVFYPGEMRVKEFESENSILIKTLRGTIQTQMPLGSSPLSDSVIDSIAVWIDEGAKNN